MKTRLIKLGEGKLIEGFGGAYYCAPNGWELLPGNFWEDSLLGEGTLYFKPKGKS